MMQQPAPPDRGRPVPALSEAEQVLQARARALARPPRAEPQQELTDVVTFGLAGEVYALDADRVLAVFRLTELTPLPGAEPPFYGLTAWRGEVLTVVDLRTLIGASPDALDDLGRVLVVGTERTPFGILADVLGQVQPLARTTLSAPLPRSGAAPGLVRGVTPDAIQWLDTDELMRLLVDIE